VFKVQQRKETAASINVMYLTEAKH